MTRGLTVATKAAAESAELHLVLLCELLFADSPQRLHTGVGSINHAGNTYLGIGSFGAVSTVDETADLSAKSIKLTLSGVDPALVYIALAEHYQGRRATIYLGLIGANGQLIPNPHIYFRGRMDNMLIEIGETATITLIASDYMADWDRPKSYRYNNDDQQSAYTGDRGLEFVTQATEKSITWGIGG